MSKKIKFIELLNEITTSADLGFGSTQIGDARHTPLFGRAEDWAFPLTRTFKKSKGKLLKRKKNKNLSKKDILKNHNFILL